MDKYKVVRKVGTGTYGSAYLIQLQSNPSQQYVLKKIKIDEDNPKEKQQAEQEVSVLSSLNHPLILGYVDHFMYKGHLCMVTEFCEAGDLYSYLRARKQPVPEAQILEWLVQVVLAIQYVHTKNILHRDLKTQNIFLTKDNTIKLGDFGISRPLNGSLDLASTLIGTPYYMSPEVMSSQPYDFKSDMWSLGCCLYEMMSLKHAFDASDISSLVCKIMRGEHLPIPSQFSPDLRDLTKTLLSRMPAKRPGPDAILKLPWIKEYVARAKDKVSRMGSQRAPSRDKRSSGSQLEVGADPTVLDRELEAAKARLAQIQNQRDALAVLKGQAAARFANRTNSGNGMPSPMSGSDGGARPPLPPGAASAASASKEGVAGGITRRLSGQQDGCLGKQLSRSASNAADPELGSNRDSNNGSLDHKARREMKKQEENRQREAELMDARRAYFEQRKQAEAKNWHLVHGETHHMSSSNGRRVTGEGPSDFQSRQCYPDSYDECQDVSQRRSAVPPHTRHGSEAAAADFEAELQLLNQGMPSFTSQYVSLANTAGVSAADRAIAIRDLCVSALGPQLLDMLYSAMRQPRQQGSSEEAYFHQELLPRLGPHRMQYLQLLDALMYYEDIAAADGPV